MEIIKEKELSEKEIIEKVIKVLQSGGIIVYPTETCYGIGVDATNQEAVDKLLRYKSRREGKPISIAVYNKDMAEKYVEVNEIAQNLYTNYLPGPITVVSKSKGKVANGVESEIGTLGIRIPDYKLILELLKKFKKPITSTSANMSYNSRPYSIEDLLKTTPQKYLDMIDLIIDAGTLPPNEPSTVVDTTLNNLNVMRQGKLLLEKDINKNKPILKAITNSSEETVNFGMLTMLKFLDIRLEKPVFFLLSGELGAGKTQFAKGIAKQLGVKEIVKSPTFNIISEYDFELAQVKGKFIHGDTWRLESYGSVEDIGLNEYLVKGNVIAFEWADKFYKDLKQMAEKSDAFIVNVVFNYLSETQREIEVRLSNK